MMTRNAQQRTDLSSPHIRSSESLGWREIVVKQCYSPRGEYVSPRSSSHLINVHLGSSISIERVRNGQSRTCMTTYGAIKIVPAGTENIWRLGDNADHMQVLLAPALMQHVAPEHTIHPIELRDHLSLQDSRIEHICLALLTELLEGGRTGQLYVECLATALAAHLLRAYTSTPRPLHETPKGLSKPLLRRVTSLIEDRLADDLSLTELASEVGLSPSHFSSLFRKETGFSPHQYVVQRRVERAQHLLRSTELPINEITSIVGFYDQSHLVRQIRRVLGVTPTSIRQHLS